MAMYKYIIILFLEELSMMTYIIHTQGGIKGITQETPNLLRFLTFRGTQDLKI